MIGINEHLGTSSFSPRFLLHFPGKGPFPGARALLTSPQHMAGTRESPNN